MHIVKKGLPGKKGPATRYSFAGAKIETPGLVASENVPKLEEASTPLPTKIDKPSPSPN